MAKKTELVVKANVLIEASYRLGLVEQQLILHAICRAREEQKGLFADQPITIRATDFGAQFGMGADNVYRQLKEAMATLYARTVTIHDTHPETGLPRVTETRWISDKSYIDGAGMVEITFGHKVIPYITRLESEFTSYRLTKIGKFTSGHAVRLYELLVQYLSIGKRSIELAWLRKTLSIEGEYTVLADFKKRVIDLSVSQINTHSDIQVSYTQRKTGRVITHLDFTILDKSKVSAKKPRVKKITAGGSDARAKPGESQDAFERRMLEQQGQQCLI